MLLGSFGLVVFLAIVALPAGVATLALLWIAGGRLSTGAAKVLAALAFTAGPAYALWRIEWFDVWRHGMPSLAYIVTAYIPYLACSAALGWFAASRLPRAARRSGSSA